MKTNLQNKNILIVDDEPDLREMLEFEFEMSGANVSTASNGRDALGLILENSYDLVISDIRMPGGDGVELVKKMNEESVDIPLVFISGFADIQVDEAYELGASGYFPKPFVLQDIVKKVEQLTTPRNIRWSDDSSVADATDLVKKTYESLETDFSGIGKGGILLTQLEKMPRIDSKIKFEILFEKENLSLSGVGSVRWVKKLKGDVGTCAGLDIQSLGDSCIDKMQSYLEEAKPLAYIPKVKV